MGAVVQNFENEISKTPNGTNFFDEKKNFFFDTKKYDIDLWGRWGAAKLFVQF